MKVEGTLAIVTGGAKGIGKAFAVQLLERKGLVGLLDMDVEQGKATESELRAKYGPKSVVFVRCDVTDTKTFGDSISECMKFFGRSSIDIMCNNAGILEHEKDLFTDHPTNIARWKKVLDINLTAVIDGTRLALNVMQKGVIINVASMSGLLVTPSQPVYAASKYGVVGFSRCLGHLAQQGIRVNAICPSFTGTDMFKNAMNSSQGFSTYVSSQGGLLNVELVAQGMCQLVEDDSQAGSVMRVTTQKGIDYQPYTAAGTPGGPSKKKPISKL